MAINGPTKTDDQRRSSMPPITNTLFDNFAGLTQIAGSFGSFNWFFRARGKSWQFHLVENASRLADETLRQPNDYWEQGAIDKHLSDEEANEMVEACLKRYWESRGRMRPNILVQKSQLG